MADAPSAAAARATIQDAGAGLSGLRAAAQPPISPNAANPATAATRWLRAARRPNRPQTASEMTTMPTVRTVFWLAPRFSMLNDTIEPGV